jgi:hypothetical protein
MVGVWYRMKNRLPFLLTLTRPANCKHMKDSSGGNTAHGQYISTIWLLNADKVSLI